MKLKSISFKNYKAFPNKEKIDIRPITILIGKNSSGKSSVSKLLPLIEKSLSNTINVPLLLNNKGVELGNVFTDLTYNQFPSTPIEFELEFDDESVIAVQVIQPIGAYFPLIYSWGYKSNGINFNLKYFEDEKCYKSDDNRKFECIFNGFIPSRIKDLSSGVQVLTEIDFNKYKIKVDYVGPFRILPPRNFSLIGQKSFSKVGIKGENAYNILAISKLHETELVTQVSNWFAKNLDNWLLDVKTTNYPMLEIVLSKKNKPKEFMVNLIDVGQGMSQVLPLVVRSFMDKGSSIVVLEQPELHLHPAAHGDIAELFAYSALKYENNFIIETHSENVILRLRRLVAERIITPEQIRIYWIDVDEEKDHSFITPIKVKENGDVEFWPDGIFSEGFEEIKAIGRANDKT